MGGGNWVILEVFDIVGFLLQVYIGYDLDEDNLELLCVWWMSVVLYYDLVMDMCIVFCYLLGYYGLLDLLMYVISDIQIIMLLNILVGL